ncbi:VWA domain-containing protein [Enterococcus canis]|nr:VWA domain-containing protein [Enterococcus canis]
MKKFWLPLVMIAVMLIPYIQTLSTAFPEKAEAVTTEKQVVLDEDYAKVEAFYEEKEDHLEWTIEFEKKASENERRIRLAIDTTDTGFGTVSDIRGDGLTSFNEEGTDLKTMKAENDEKKLDWYYAKLFSTDVEKGTLKFSSEKVEEVGELPLMVAIDEQVIEKETSDEESEKAAEESDQADSELKDEESKQEDERQNNSSEKAEDSSDDSSKKEDSSTETKEESKKKNVVSLAEQAAAVKRMQTLAIRNIFPLAGALEVDLGPFAPSDPFKYKVLDNAHPENRYPTPVTNDFTNPLSGNNFANGTYTNSSANPLFDTEGNVIDTDYESGGANWRNYDYSATDENAQTNPDGKGYGPTVQLWGDTQNFANSYLDYNGAYLKKWVEPITSHVGNDQEKTTIYNVYLDVIGGSKQTIQPLDIVFVLDKSASMDNAVGGGTSESRIDILVSSVEEMVKDLFANKNLDLRVGMADFKGSVVGDYDGSTGIKADKFELSDSLADILNEDENIALYADIPAMSGTPLSLGIQKGYEVLYKDQNENREKILIVVGDGMPTYAYTGFKYSNRTNDNIYGRNSNNWSEDDSVLNSANYLTANGVLNQFWATDKEGSFIRNYATGSNSSFTKTETYPTSFDINELKSVIGFNGTGEIDFDTDYRSGWQTTTRKLKYRFGEDTSWVIGNGQTATHRKEMAVSTIAYHHWLKDKYVSNPNTMSPRVYSIGLGLSNSDDDALGTNVLKNIADLKSTTGTDSYYYGAQSKDELTKALQEIAGDFIRTIQNADLYDETGSNVSLYNAGTNAQVEYFHLDSAGESASTKYKTPVAWDEALHGKKPDVTAHPTTYEEGSRDNHAYRFSGISLGEGDMVRIKYQVKLDAGAQNGNFYAVNNQAYLMNESDRIEENDNKMYIPAPSIRYQHNQRNLQIRKTDENDNPILGITLTLYREPSSGDADEDISIVHGRRVVKIEDKITESSGQAIFDTQFDLLDNADSEKYWVGETSGPSHYELLDYLIPFQIHKELAASGEKTGHYELTDFTGMPDGSEGTRVAEEVSYDTDKTHLWPYAYNSVDSLYSMYIVQTLSDSGSGEVDEDDFYQQFDQLYVQLDLKNPMKPLRVGINKLISGTAGEILPGAEFELQKQNGDDFEKVAEGTADKDGKVHFKKENDEAYNLEIDYTATNGLTNYRIYETLAPDGYETPNPDNVFWNVRIDMMNNRISYQKNGDAMVYKTFAELLAGQEDKSIIELFFDVFNEMTDREILVKKVDSEGNPLNGVGFEIERTGGANTYKAYSGILGKDDFSEDGTGKFYQKIKPEIGEPEIYKDQDFNLPYKLVPGKCTVKEVNPLLGYTPLAEEFEFEILVNGDFEFENPEDSSYGFEVSDDKTTLTLTVKNELQPMLLEILKLDSHTEKELAGAEFEIAKQDEQGTWEAGEKLTIDGNGYLFTKDPIEVGRYKITETKAPDGFRKLPGYFVLDISLRAADESDSDGTIIHRKGSIKAEVTYYDDEDNEVESRDVQLEQLTEEDTEKVKIAFNISNDPKHPLPSTGGQGRERYFLIAAAVIIAMGAVGAVYVFRNRKGAK